MNKHKNKKIIWLNGIFIMDQINFSGKMKQLKEYILEKLHVSKFKKEEDLLAPTLYKDIKSLIA